MKVLYITPYVPSAIRVRPYELLRALTERGVYATVLCASTPGDEAALRELRSWGLDVHAIPVAKGHRLQALVGGWLAGLPLQAAFGAVAPLRRALRELLARSSYDLVHIEHLRAAALLDETTQLPVVYDSVDSISLLLERTRSAGVRPHDRIMAALELRRTRALEARICGQARVTVVTSPEDADALRAGAPGASVRVVPNGVALERFAPGGWPRRRSIVIMTGKMSYHANIAAAKRLVERIMPRVWEHVPGARVWLVGSDPPRLLQCYGKHPGIVVTGRVPDIAAYLRQATVAVNPLCYGVGIQNKVLEAMATATPVVVDSRSIAALEARDGRDLRVADDDVGFAQSIVELLQQPAVAEEIGRRGRAYVETHHRWAGSAGRLLDAYNQALQATAAVPAIQERRPQTPIAPQAARAAVQPLVQHSTPPE